MSSFEHLKEGDRVQAHGRMYIVKRVFTAVGGQLMVTLAREGSNGFSTVPVGLLQLEGGLIIEKAQSEA